MPETLVLRVPEESKVLQEFPGNLGREAVPELTELVECLENQVPRATGALMVCLVFPVRRDTGEKLEIRAPSELPVRMDREEKMERSGQGDWLGRVALEVCSAHVVLPDQPDNLVLLA